jgi:hypothetical protein
MVMPNDAARCHGEAGLAKYDVNRLRNIDTPGFLTMQA